MPVPKWFYSNTCDVSAKLRLQEMGFVWFWKFKKIVTWRIWFS